MLTLTILGAVAAGGGGQADPSAAALTMLVIFVLLALGVSFLCSIAEAVLLSVTPSYIEGLKDKKPKLAELLDRVKNEGIEQSLAAILTLNTIAHTVGALGAGAQASKVFGGAAVGIFSALMTLAILFLSEIIPKTIGAVYWRKLAGINARFVRILVIGLYPLVVVSEWLTRLVKRGDTSDQFDREEIVAMTGIGERAGVVDPKESRIVRNLFRFGQLEARDIMTPRPVVRALRQDRTVVEVFQQISEAPFSRLPIHDGDPDRLNGFVLRDDILMRHAADEFEVTLDQLRRELAAVPERINLADLLEFFLDRSEHLAVVVDERGTTRGLVTLEDVIETLLGLEIVDETDSVEDMRLLARKKWEERAEALGLTPEEIAEGEVDGDG